MGKSKKNDAETPKRDEETALKQIRLTVNEFGEIVKDVKTEQINAFLDENVPDKKFSEEEKEK